MCQIKEMKRLIEQLNIWRDEYYNQARPSVSDTEFDAAFDRLVELEKEAGVVMSNSPTQTVGYEVKSVLNKKEHDHPMLSLAKTKDLDEIKKWIGDLPALAMLKMDGLTITLRYVNGELVSAETRGDGHIGEDVLHNVKVFKNVPLKIDYLDELIVDGEAIITYPDFKKINEKLPEKEKYKNPRNLASGSVRQLDSKIAAERNLQFIAWKVVKGFEQKNFIDDLLALGDYGFTRVPFVSIDKYDTQDLSGSVEILKHGAERHGYPIDGLVFSYNDVEYGKSLGATGHHVRSQIAFKFQDEIEETTLLKVEYNVSKNGILTPVAVFEPVELEGTIVEKASVHNISILEDLDLRIGDSIKVFKANQIIPQILENISSKERRADGNISGPNPVNTGVCGVLDVILSHCRVCNSPTEIIQEKDTKVLICTNPNCKGKLLGRLTAFCSRKAHNINGLSEATLQLLIHRGYVTCPKDLYLLKGKKAELSTLPGLGARSVDKLLAAIEESRNTTLERFLVGLNIPLIGSTASKEISKAFSGDFDQFLYMWSTDNFNWTKLEGFGQNMSESLSSYYKENEQEIRELTKEFNFVSNTKPSVNTDSTKSNLLEGKVFVVTGSVNHFKNRNELKEKIEELGGKVTGSVTKKTDYLINNDNKSTSSKNKKALELNIPIITEEEFVAMIN